MIIPDDVKPSMTIPNYSFPCQKKVAKIRNQTLERMRQGDIGNVAYYLLKCKKGLLCTFMIMFLGLGYLLSVVLLVADKCFGEEERCSNILYSYLVLVPLSLYPFLPTNIMNILRYKKTINDCSNWLEMKLDEVAFQKVEGLHFYEHEALCNILSDSNLEATLLYSDPLFPVKRIERSHRREASQTAEPNMYINKNQLKLA